MRKKIFWTVLSALLMGIVTAPLAITQDEWSFRVNKVTDRIVVFQTGNHLEDACVTVIMTKKGLIVVDTGGFPTLAEQYKKKIKEVLERDDFIYVINTHDNIDHTGGNQAFAGAAIIGHENSVPVIKRMAAEKEQIYAHWRPTVNRGEQELKSTDPNSREALAQAEYVRWFQGLIADESRFIPTPPTKTFGDRLTLPVDDLTVKLYHFGSAHTDNDILIQIKPLGVLFVGDLFHPTRLSANATRGLPADVPRWLEVLGEILKNEGEIKTVIGGHAHIFSGEWMNLQYRYMKDLWEVVTRAKTGGINMRALQEQNTLDKNFPYVQKFFDLSSQSVRDRHKANIQTFWRVGQRSAANEIEKILNSSGLNPARERFDELRGAAGGAFYLDEQEINALGYKLLQNRKTT